MRMGWTWELLAMQGWTCPLPWSCQSLSRGTTNYHSGPRGWHSAAHARGGGTSSATEAVGMNSNAENGG